MDIKSNADKNKNWDEVGFLGLIGYVVGKTRGKIQTGRRELLQTVFELYIPESDRMRVDWGPRATATRLREMAERIAFFTRNEKKNKHGDYSQAVSDHEDDLDFLYNKYYVGRYNFVFPKTSKRMEETIF